MSRRGNTVGKRTDQQKKQNNDLSRARDDYNFNRSKNQGLPNIGNTCFLNSAIQFLYSSSEFRKRIYCKRKFVTDQQLEYHIISIFGCIQDKKSYLEKFDIMAQMTALLRQMNVDYQKYSQQDCFQFILLILDYLGGKYPDLLQLFKLYYKFSCPKCENSIKRNKEYVLSKLQVTCQCNGTMEVKLIAKSTCLIFQNTQKPPKKLTLKSVDQEDVIYNLTAKVLYIGNGRYGHYKVSRRLSDNDSENFSNFSDSSVTQQKNTTYSGFNEKCLLCLYQIEGVKPMQKSSHNEMISQNKQINNDLYAIRNLLYSIDDEKNKYMINPQKNNSQLQKQVKFQKPIQQLQNNNSQSKTKHVSAIYTECTNTSQISSKQAVKNIDFPIQNLQIKDVKLSQQQLKKNERNIQQEAGLSNYSAANQINKKPTTTQSSIHTTTNSSTSAKFSRSPNIDIKKINNQTNNNYKNNSSFLKTGQKLPKQVQNKCNQLGSINKKQIEINKNQIEIQPPYKNILISQKYIKNVSKQYFNNALQLQQIQKYYRQPQSNTTKLESRMSNRNQTKLKVTLNEYKQNDNYLKNKQNDNYLKNKQNDNYLKNKKQDQTYIQSTIKYFGSSITGQFLQFLYKKIYIVSFVEKFNIKIDQDTFLYKIIKLQKQYLRQNLSYQSKNKIINLVTENLIELDRKHNYHNMNNYKKQVSQYFNNDKAQQKKIIFYLTLLKWIFIENTKVYQRFLIDFKYKCQYCKKNHKQYGFFINQNQFKCCKYKIDLRNYQISNRPQYIIFISKQTKRGELYFKNSQSKNIFYNVSQFIATSYNESIMYILQSSKYYIKFMHNNSYTSQKYLDDKTPLRQLTEQSPLIRNYLYEKKIRNQKVKLKLNQKLLKMDYSDFRNKTISQLNSSTSEIVNFSYKKNGYYPINILKFV